MGKYYIDKDIWKMCASGIIGVSFALAAIAGNKYLEQSGVINGPEGSLFSFTMFIGLAILTMIIIGIRKKADTSVSIV